MLELRPYQQEAVDSVYQYLRDHDDNPCVVLPTGCHGINHPIRMFDWSVKLVQDIQVGDLLMGRDMTPRVVIQLARGRSPMVRIVTDDGGDPFIVNRRHLFPVVEMRGGDPFLARPCELNIIKYYKLLRWNGKAFEYVRFHMEPLKTDDFYGFALDGDHYYLDGFGFVHHNTGKSIVIGKIASDAVSLWNGRVLILAHVKELLEQNASKVKALCPGIPLGIYSAGLGSRDTKSPVLVAGIQSVYDKADVLGAFNLIIVDEAHLIAPDGDGMYRRFLEDMKLINPNVRVIGMTATPFRMRGGLICKPENILNAVCYEAGIKEMIAKGFLSHLISRAGRTEANLHDLHIRCGEFISTEISDAMDKAEITNEACKEIVELTKNRKSVLIFTTSIDHCRHVCDVIHSLSGMECAMITGSTPSEERAEMLDRFKGKVVRKDMFSTELPQIKFLANVNVLTTGFDAVNVDCIVLLRPTASPGLLIQMVGRGFRLSPSTGKTDCLVLDFGENIIRHGPIDCICIKDKTPGHGDAPAKKCPECMSLIHAAYSKCPFCGYEFPPPSSTNLQGSASRAGILSGETTYTDYDVDNVFYSVHSKRGADDSIPKTMRVDYVVGYHQLKSEWVCPEHSGYTRNKFEKWWKARAAIGCPLPATAKEAVSLANANLLAEPTSIRVKEVSGEKFERICSWTLKERPVMREPGDDRDEVDYQSNSPADMGVRREDDSFDDIPF